MSSLKTTQQQTTQRIVDKRRPGFYPQRPQHRSLTFNETFRALFPAILAVLLSLIAITAFNNIESSVWLDWVEDTFHFKIPGYYPSNKQIANIPPPIFYGPQSPFLDPNYEKLGPLTKGVYWETKHRRGMIETEQDNIIKLKEFQKRIKPLDLSKPKDRKDYEELGPFTKGSYWEMLGRAKEQQQRLLASKKQTPSQLPKKT
eukprot:gene2028-2495_t